MSDIVKYDTNKGWPADTVETRIATAIWSDICDRSGFDLGGLDDDIQEEIYNAWLGHIRKAMVGRPA